MFISLSYKRLAGKNELLRDEGETLGYPSRPAVGRSRDRALALSVKGYSHLEIWKMESVPISLGAVRATALTEIKNCKMASPDFTILISLSNKEL